MLPDRWSRKQFLATLGSATAGSMLFNAVLPTPVHAPESFGSSPGESEYLFSEGLTYLNTGTLGPCRRDTVNAVFAIWQELESLPVKFYGKFGAEAIAEETRGRASKFMGCDISEIMIMHSTTNGMNAIAQGLRLKAGDRILTTDQEHGGGLLGWKYMAKYHGVIIDTVQIPPGENNADLILERIEASLRKRTRLISVSHILSSTGLRMPVTEIASLARANNTLCIVDGAQAAGAIRVNVKELGCHAYATSGHKWLMGPKGTGILYLSKEAQEIIRPMQFEQSYNTYNDSNGVVNLACITGLGKAIEYIESVGVSEIEAHNTSLRNRLYDQLTNLNNATLLSPAAGPLASSMIALLLSDRFEKRAFVSRLLEKHNISIRPTHPEFGFNGIRFSIHYFNTAKEIDFATNVLREELK